jgi:hypothetical protein
MIPWLHVPSALAEILKVSGLVHLLYKTNIQNKQNKTPSRFHLTEILKSQWPSTLPSCLVSTADVGTSSDMRELAHEHTLPLCLVSTEGNFCLFRMSAMSYRHRHT